MVRFYLKEQNAKLVFDLKQPKLDIIRSRMGTAKDASGKKDTAVHSINALDSTPEHISPLPTFGFLNCCILYITFEKTLDRNWYVTISLEVAYLKKKVKR